MLTFTTRNSPQIDPGQFGQVPPFQTHICVRAPHAREVPEVPEPP